MKKYSWVMASTLSLSLIFGVSVANAKSPIEQCYQSIKDQPRTALQPCLNTMFEHSEKTLNQAYKKNKAELEEIDSTATKKAVKSLKRSQKYFKQFRNEECQRRSDEMMGGSGAGDELISCKIELNYWQANNL